MEENVRYLKNKDKKNDLQIIGKTADEKKRKRKSDW